MQQLRLDHQFVEFMPNILQPGILYISMEYATATHLCCCGCGEKVVTPFTPTDWSMTFNGYSVSLSPSIGNWNLPCRSHYVISQGRVIGANPWSDQRIAAERLRDRAAKAAYYGSQQKPPRVSIPSDRSSTHHQPRGLWQRILHYLLRS